MCIFIKYPLKVYFIIKSGEGQERFCWQGWEVNEIIGFYNFLSKKTRRYTKSKYFLIFELTSLTQPYIKEDEYYDYLETYDYNGEYQYQYDHDYDPVECQYLKNSKNMLLELVLKVSKCNGFRSLVDFMTGKNCRKFMLLIPLSFIC